MSNVLDIAFIGAGTINFGYPGDPWNHSARLESLGNVRFTAIVDVLKSKAGEILQDKLSGPKRQLYESCKVYGSLAELLSEQKPHVVVLGTPPGYRGSTEQGRDLELTVVSNGVNLFVEKPVSTIVPEEFSRYVQLVEKARSQNNVVVSVGYMFRYHTAILKMKELIASHGGKVMLFNARYYVAYSAIDRAFWWDVTTSGGPVVEQATHFYDVARFLVGDIVNNSVETVYLRDSDPGGAGKLASIPEGCDTHLPQERKIPRAHIATWRFQEGGLGTLSHCVALHGYQYETSLEILMDGLRMTLYEPYTTRCKLLVRDSRSGTDEEISYDFGDADPYEVELRTFINAIRDNSNSSASKIASTYPDAAKTYEFTWAVRRAGEASRK